MKMILLGSLISLSTYACPDLSGVYTCPGPEGDSSTMTVKMEKISDGHRLSIQNVYSDEVMTKVMTMTPVDIQTDEFGIQGRTYCEGDQVIIETSKGNLSGKASVSLKNGNFSIEGSAVGVQMEVDSNGNPIEKSLEYFSEDSSLLCTRK